MTQTTSFKSKLSTAFSLFKWELRSCAGILTVYSILAAVFIFITLTLTIITSSLNQAANDPNTYDTLSIFSLFTETSEIGKFQIFASNIIYFLTIIFTIVFTIKIFSYLHNKRKADFYGSMPIGRITMYFSRCATALIFSIAPAFFFLGIISIISICFGQPLLTETSMMFIKIFLGSLACISAYGFFAVCCGTTVNSVFMFIFTCIAYPLSALFITATIKAFFSGLYLGITGNSLIINALNPLEAYNGTHIVYWIVFTIVCFALSAWLVRNRKYERAQNSFAFFLPVHIVKLLVSFIIGMILGNVFGAINLFGISYVGFIVGFVVGSAAAFVICHLIFYKSFRNFLKSSILLGILVAVVTATVGIFCLDPTGYNSYVPNIEDVKSAGYVDLSNCYIKENKGINSIANDATEDFSDEVSIKNIIYGHKDILFDRTFSTQEKFINVWARLLTDGLGIDTSDRIFSYKLNNGSTIKRVYTSSYVGVSRNTISYYDFDMTAITLSKTYMEKYSALYNYNSTEIESLTFDFTDGNYDEYSFNISSNGNAEADRKKLIDALKKDISEGKEISDNGYYNYSSDLITISIKVSGSYFNRNMSNSSLMSFINGLDLYKSSQTITVSKKDFTNTIKALKEVGILDENENINLLNEYYDNYYYY